MQLKDLHFLVATLILGLVITAPALAQQSKRQIADVEVSQKRSASFAAAGKAFEITETPTGRPKAELIRTTFPVLNVFDFDGVNILYNRLDDIGVPMPGLILENVSNGVYRKLTSKIVFTATRSPRDDIVGFTFADADGTGIGTVNLISGDETIINRNNIVPDELQWDSTGKRLLFIESEERSQLVRKPAIKNPVDERGFSVLKTRAIDIDYAGTSSGNVYEVSADDIPAGFPMLTRKIDAEQLAPFVFENAPPLPAELYQYKTRVNSKTEIIADNLIGIGSIRIRSGDGTEREIAKGSLVSTLENGAIVREFKPGKTEIKYVSYSGETEMLAATSVNFGLPLASAVCTQGGSGYGTATGNCYSNHTGSMGFAIDLQSQTAGAHILAPAPGLVVYARGDVSCNSCDTNSCAVYSTTCRDDQSNYGWGNALVLQMADGTYFKVTHMRAGSIKVAVGETVVAGRYLGDQGATGCTVGNFENCGSHAHVQRQSSSALSGTSIAMGFTENGGNPLKCGTTYRSSLTETTGGSTGGGTIDLINNQTANGTLARGQSQLYRINLPTGVQSIKWEMTGSGDADLYTKAGTAPTSTSYYCRPYASSSYETCDQINPPAGYYYAWVNGYASSSTFSLKVSYTTNNPDVGTIYVKATLNGAPWSGPLSFNFDAETTPSGTSVPATLTNRPSGGYGIRLLSGGPAGAVWTNTVPSVFQNLPAGGSVTWTFEFRSSPSGVISVDATLNGAPWNGPMSFRLSGPSPADGTYAPSGFSNRTTGSYTVSYVSGGPANARLISVSPSATQTLGSTGIRFTLNFASSLVINSLAPPEVVAGKQTTLVASTTNARSPIRAFVTTSAGTFEIAQAGIWVDSSSQVRVQITMQGTNLPYTATLRLQNPDGYSASRTFKVVAPPPTISSVSPDTVRLNQQTTLTVNGTGFRSPVRAFVITNSGTFEIAAAGITFVNSNQVRVSVKMGGTSSYSARLRIVNSDGQSAERTFQVVP